MCLRLVEDQATSGLGVSLVTADHSLTSTLLPGRPFSRSEATATGHGPVMDRPIRVLMITEASGGGSGRHVLDLSEGLLARGCDVHLIYSPGRARPILPRALEPDRFAEAGPPYRCGRNIHPGDLPALRWIRRYIRDFGPFDVIHGHSAKGAHWPGWPRSPRRRPSSTPPTGSSSWTRACRCGSGCSITRSNGSSAG